VGLPDHVPLPAVSVAPVCGGPAMVGTVRFTGRARLAAAPAGISVVKTTSDAINRTMRRDTVASLPDGAGEAESPWHAGR
jgi:hypothetical protein